MINSIIFTIEFVWFSIVRDTILMFEQFFYLSLLTGLVPGTMFFTTWVIN